MTRLLADVLWEAANKRLRADNENGHLDDDDVGMGGVYTLSSYSCNAAEIAESQDAYHGRCNAETTAFLKELGVEAYAYRGLREEFPDGAERQGVRYMWLLLAMHVAEDECVEIEEAA